MSEYFERGMVGIGSLLAVSVMRHSLLLHQTDPIEAEWPPPPPPETEPETL